MMLTFRFFWLDGKTEDGSGTDVVDAFRRLGYGGGAVGALDYYKQLSEPSVRGALDDLKANASDGHAQSKGD